MNRFIYFLNMMQSKVKNIKESETCQNLTTCRIVSIRTCTKILSDNDLKHHEAALETSCPTHSFTFFVKIISNSPQHCSVMED